MKRVVAVMTACVIAAVLVVALLAIEDKPVKRDETVGKSIETVASVVDTDGTDVLLKSEEPEKHALLQQADYDQIKKEIADPEYRKRVKIAKKKYVVIRKENDKTGSIEDESWYKNSGARSYDVISRDDAGNGEAVVSYEISTGKKKDIWDVVDKLNQPEYDDEILITEPVYYYYTCNEGQPSEVNNPGMANEWYLSDQNMNTIWGDPDTYGDATGEGTVVAVIDTGVDYTHEDLEDNMWMNTAELQGEDNVDDDNNGYIDDIYGINMIDGSSDPKDDNGHGTHVSGIIAMADNNIGGVGLAYKSKIMAIKASDASGVLNSLDISEGLEYASANKADVINMSFGGYGHSAVVENALRLAFSTSVLVASAGNDSIPTKDSLKPDSGNNYPAAYPYVIGVMAMDRSGNLTDFSNWDYKTGSGPEYEICAPGSGIYSTFPDNSYASWNGTSMAAPVVSAAAAILRSTHPDEEGYSSRYIMGQITGATEDTVSYEGNQYARLNIADSILKSPKPNIYVDEVYMFDSPEIDNANNGDGIVQPGEVIDLAIGLRNQWGEAKEVFVTANANSYAGIPNQYVQFVTEQEVRINDIGPFGTQDNGFIRNEQGAVTGVSNPIRVKISEEAPNDVNIAFNINYHAKNADDSDSTVYSQIEATKFILSVQKGTVLSGKIDRDITLTKENYYIIENTVLVPKGVTVNVEEGTKIQFWSADPSNIYGDNSIAGIQVNGVMNFLGSAAEPIELFSGKDYGSYRVEVCKNGDGIVNMDYVNIINPYIKITRGSHLNLSQDYDQMHYRDYRSDGSVSDSSCSPLVNAESLSYSNISNLRGALNPTVSGVFDTVQFDNCQIDYQHIKAKNCTFLINQGRLQDGITGRLEYYTSIMNNSGNMFHNPNIELASDITEYNGKKYAVYSYSWNPISLPYSGNELEEVSYPTLKALLQIFEKNGGSISYMTESAPESERNLMLGELLNTVDSGLRNNVLTGIYYDRDNNVITSSTESDADLSWYDTLELSAIKPFAVLATKQYTDEESVQHTSVCVNRIYSDSLPRCVLVEYPAEKEDYKIEHLNNDLTGIDIIKGTDFKNNAILNRLASNNINDWMRLTSNYDNSTIIAADGNYWGTTDKGLIQKQLIDLDTNIRFADYIVEPYLDTVPESAYPAVSDVYILDKNNEKVTSIGSGEYEVHVLFNRDMDISVQPMVTYGPDDPYTDFTVKGDFISAREWKGTMNVKVQMNQGIQYFRIKGAVAEDDPWLVSGTDWGRFTFRIEASGAEALILQSEGQRGAVHLTWTQDEYETLAGYNVYRSSTGQNGPFKKINTSIVVADAGIMEYTDKNVDASEKYWYYFTVVDTALKESRPSNIASCSPIDDQPPVIKHTPSETITYGINAVITAAITDNVGVNRAVLYYRMQGDSAFTPTHMIRTNEDTFSVQIPASSLSEGILEYYIEAYDAESASYDASEEEPYTVPVECNAVLTSITVGNGEVGQTLEASLKGVNFTEDMEVHIDGNAVDSTFISSGQINIEYEPEFMGKKKVELVRNNVVLATLSKAIVISDPSIRVYNTQDVILLKDSSYQVLKVYSNFIGKLNSVEISFYDPGNMVNMIYLESGYRSLETTNDNGIRTFSFITNGKQFEGGLLSNFSLYNLSESFVPDIRSFKINDIEIDNIDFDGDRITFVNQEDYIPVEAISPEHDLYEVNIGDTFEPIYTVTPSNATFSSVSVSASEGLRINGDGTFTAVKSGMNYINLTSRDTSTMINVRVKSVPLTEITASQLEVTGMEGETVTLSVQAYPLISDTQIRWSLQSGDDVLDFVDESDSRNVKAKLKKAGTGTYRAYSADDSNIYALIVVTVSENTSYVDLLEDIVTLEQNQTHMLTSVIRNSSGEHVISWSTSNSAVASVENGQLTARGNGVAVITAVLEDGKGADSVIVLVGTNSMAYTLGDVNLDGRITSTDAMLTLKLAISGDCNDVFLKIADVNADQMVSSTDAAMILQYVTGKIKDFEAYQ